MPTNTTVLDSLERRRASLLLLAGVLLFGYAVSKAIYTFGDVTPVGAFDVAFGGIGLLVTLFGLLAIYPALREGAPRLSVAALVATLVATVGNLALLGWLAVATLTKRGYPAVPAEAPAWTVLALIVVFVTLALAFLLAGAASLRGAVFSTTVGRLLLVPGLGWVALIAGNLALPSGQYLGLVYFPMSLALFAVARRLVADSVRTDAVDRAPDSAA